MKDSPATKLLQRLGEGDSEAAEELLPLIYTELHAAARNCMRGERAGHTLQTTALVHEAWMRLVGGAEPPRAESRVHFVRLAARAMRRVLVDHARARAAGKRGHRVEVDTVEALAGVFEERSIDVLALDELLERLVTFDEQLGRLVELRYFAGLSVPEVAGVLDVSVSTVERGWRSARAWLRAEMPGAE